MPCPLCGSIDGNSHDLCPSCRELRHQDPGAFNQLVAARQRGEHSEIAALFQEYRSKICAALTVLVALALMVLYSHGVFGFGTLPPAPIASISRGVDPCRHKERCIVAFFAPWCPACQASHSTMRALEARAAVKDRVGVQIIVGRDSREELAKMAHQIGGTVFLDQDDSFAAAAGVGAVPAWWVADKERKILARGTGMVAASDPRAPEIEYFVKNYLKLDGFM